MKGAEQEVCVKETRNTQNVPKYPEVCFFKKRDHLITLGIDGSIMLKWIFEEWFSC
jgi:hypothetical protein